MQCVTLVVRAFTNVSYSSTNTLHACTTRITFTHTCACAHTHAHTPIIHIHTVSRVCSCLYRRRAALTEGGLSYLDTNTRTMMATVYRKYHLKMKLI